MEGRGIEERRKGGKEEGKEGEEGRERRRDRRKEGGKGKERKGGTESTDHRYTIYDDLQPL